MPNSFPLGYWSFLTPPPSEIVDNIRVTVLYRGQPSPVSEPDRQKLLSDAQQLLSQAPITDAFRQHIMTSIRQQSESPFLATLGPRMILDECGIDIGQDNSGIFDPFLAQTIETRAIITVATLPFVSEELVAKNEAEVDSWRHEFITRYHLDPFEE